MVQKMTGTVKFVLLLSTLLLAIHQNVCLMQQVETGLVHAGSGSLMITLACFCSVIIQAPGSATQQRYPAVGSESDAFQLDTACHC